MPRDTGKVKFSRKQALEKLGERLIDNNAKAVAAAISEVLQDQQLPVNETELLRWAEFDYNRRRGRWQGPNYTPPPIKPSTVVDITVKYLGNWYKKHVEWLRGDKG